MAAIRINDPLTAEQLRAILDYDPETGVFTWRHRPNMSVQWNGKWAGKQAGCPHAEGYIGIRINGHRYRASWLAWLWVRGSWPAEFIDHKNIDRSDNRIANLREATKSENGSNRMVQPNNTSGLKGVSRKRGKWRARIKHLGNDIHLGSFATKADAYRAYCEAAERLHGKFARFR